ncbi:MAG: hypothetical protein ACPH4N_01250 [Flavobacteriaceae bacterium]
MASLRSVIRNRDEAFQDDIVMFGVDTFGDDYLIQPLQQWNPTPFIIFYMGVIITTSLTINLMLTD